MATRAVHSLEGTATAEQAELVGDATLDSTVAIVGGFDIETAGVYIGGGSKSVVQRVYIEADTEGQTVTVQLVLDDTTTTLGTFSTAVGEKTTAEFAVNRAGFIAGVRAFLAEPTIRLEIVSIEMDIYTPDES